MKHAGPRATMKPPDVIVTGNFAANQGSPEKSVSVILMELKRALLKNQTRRRSHLTLFAWKMDRGDGGSERDARRRKTTPCGSGHGSGDDRCTRPK